MLILNGKQKKKNCAECLCHVGRDIYHPALEHVFGDFVFADSGDSFDRLVDVVGFEGSRTRTESNP